MTTAHDPCAMCECYTLNRASLPAGHGWCTAWGEQKPWDGQIGVLFTEARDRAPRARYVAQQQAQQQELEKA
jgi:hypothetical protein